VDIFIYQRDEQQRPHLRIASRGKNAIIATVIQLVIRWPKVRAPQYYSANDWGQMGAAWGQLLRDPTVGPPGLGQTYKKSANMHHSSEHENFAEN